MKFVSFNYKNRDSFGILLKGDKQIVDVSLLSNINTFPKDMSEFLFNFSENHIILLDYLKNNSFNKQSININMCKLKLQY